MISLVVLGVVTGQADRTPLIGLIGTTAYIFGYVALTIFLQPFSFLPVKPTYSVPLPGD